MISKIEEITPKLRVAGLFAGIGGLELGLEKAGHETELLCEIDPSANAVLDARFPGILRRADVRSIDVLPSSVNLLAAGFPCQDLSQAGGTRGINGSQSGLVSHVFRLLRKHEVPWVLLENVPFMLQLNKGAAIRLVVSELEELGYRWAYRVVDSRAFGLPQRRQRVFLLASLEEDPARLMFREDKGEPPTPEHNGHACGFYWTEGTRGLGWAVNAIPTLKGGSTVGIPSPPAIWMPNGDIVTPDIRDAERLQGFPANWTRPAESAGRASYRWKLVGNAVSVRTARWVASLFTKKPGKLPTDLYDLPESKTWSTAAFGSRDGRAAVIVSTFPKHNKVPPLTEFLRFPPKLLSEKATTGFRNRLKASTLRHPPEFMQALERHLGRMTDITKD